MIKRLIRYLYWKYAHKGDFWQARLVVYHMSNVAQVYEDKPLPNTMDLFFGEINEKMGKIVGFSQVKFNFPEVLKKGRPNE